MDLARILAQSEKGDGLVVMADSQMAGRGRIESRTWSDSPGASLLFTIGIRNIAQDLAALPLRVGLALADALSSAFPGLELRLKWPNDLMASSPAEAGSDAGDFRKLGGILCEAAGDWFFAGVGINLSRKAYPDSLAAKATSICQVLGRHDEALGSEAREELALAAGLSLLARLADPDWRKAYEKRLWAVGEEVVFTIGHPMTGRSECGTILGIDEFGHLLLSAPGGGTMSHASGEISGLKLT